MLATSCIALLLLAAPQLEIKAGTPIRLDGEISAEEWADAWTQQTEGRFVKLKRNGAWLAVAFGGKGSYYGEVLRLEVSDAEGAWQTVMALTGGLPAMPPAVWIRGNPAAIRRALAKPNAMVRNPRAARARVLVDGAESWSAEYLLRLEKLGIGRADERSFRMRCVLAVRGAGVRAQILFPPDTTDQSPVSTHAELISPDGWGRDEKWEPIPTEASLEFDDNELLWRLSTEHQHISQRDSSTQLVIAEAVRPRTMAKINSLRAQLEKARKRNPTLPSLRYFLGRLLHEGNLYDDAAKLIESIGEAQSALDANVNLLVEHYIDTEQWEKALAVCRANPDATGIPEAQRSANTVRVMVQAEAELDKARSQAGKEELPLVRIHTRKGVIEVELFEDDAAHAVYNFVDLVMRKKYYDGMRFRPVTGGSYAILGNPRTQTGGSGGPEGPLWRLRADKSGRQPLTGRLVTVPVAEGVHHGSQFAITLSPMLGGHERVATFGRVVKGMDVLLQLEQDDIVDKIEVVRRRNHRYDALASRVK